MNFAHLDRLERIFRYQSPPARDHALRQIQPGYEEIEVIVSGIGHFVSDGIVYDAGPGSSLWYYEGDTVEVKSHHQTPYETIVFCYRVTGMPPDATMPVYSEWQSAGSCAQFCQSALENFASPPVLNPHFTLCTYARLYWEACEFRKHRNRQSLPVQVDNAVCYINRHYADNVGITDIAKFAGVSGSHLHLLFREHLQTSPIQYLLKVRLQKAQELLLNTDESVKQICYLAGFSDIKNFYTYFRKANNLTPGQYRKITLGTDR